MIQKVVFAIAMLIEKMTSIIFVYVFVLRNIDLQLFNTHRRLNIRYCCPQQALWYQENKTDQNLQIDIADVTKISKQPTIAQFITPPILSTVNFYPDKFIKSYERTCIANGWFVKANGNESRDENVHKIIISRTAIQNFRER